MTDHTEMQIPDDVMEAAGKALHDPTADINGNSLRYFIDERYVNMAAAVIARAILKERERCARIAIRQAPATQDFADAPLQELATRIAAKIRSVDK